MVPIVILVIFLMILLTMYVHNRAWYTAAAGEALITASTQGVRKEQYAGKILSEKMSKRINKQGFPAGTVSASTTVSGDTLKVEVDITSLKVPMLPVWKAEISEETKLIKPVSWIRNMQAIEAWKGENDGS